MQIADIGKALRNSFFSYGWLMPAVLPLASVIGRGVFNSLMAIYFIWGIAGLGRSLFRDVKIPLLLFAVLLASFLPGVIGGVDPEPAFKAWLRFVAYSFVFFFTIAVLRQRSGNIDRLIRTYAIWLIPLLIYLYASLLYFAAGDNFIPSIQLKEDNLPYLLPFLMYWLTARVKGRWNLVAVSVAVLALVIMYITISQGRAAMLAFLMGAVLFLYLVYQYRARLIVAGAVILILVSVGAMGERFYRNTNVHSSWMEMADSFTSYRTLLWRRAIENPPDNPWIGIGMKNAGSYKTDPSVDAIPVHLNSLHNFIMDSWYQTGYIGSAALILFLVIMLGFGISAWRRLPADRRYTAGVLLTAAFTLLTASTLSFSYTYRFFSIQLFVFFAGFWYLREQVYADRKK